MGVPSLRGADPRTATTELGARPRQGLLLRRHRQGVLRRAGREPACGRVPQGRVAKGAELQSVTRPPHAPCVLGLCPCLLLPSASLELACTRFPFYQVVTTPHSLRPPKRIKQTRAAHPSPPRTCGVRRLRRDQGRPTRKATTVVLDGHETAVTDRRELEIE